MPKSSPADAAARSGKPDQAAVTDEAALFPLDQLRIRADRLARAAKEAARQHQRCATLCERADVHNDELDGVIELTALADGLLHDAMVAYEKASARLQPDGDDREWWQKANALWLAAREHVRRHELGDRLLRRVRSEHSPVEFAQLAVGNALAASAILSLQQAAESYCQSRPEAVR